MPPTTTTPLSIEHTATHIAAHARFEGYCKAIRDVALLAQGQEWTVADEQLSRLVDDAQKKHEDETK